jgi:hypothetical protein
MARGRIIPRYPAGRLDRAAEIAAPHVDAMREAISRLPLEVRLADARVLRCVQQREVQRGYRCTDGMVVLASFDPLPPDGELLLHISVSYKARDPRWTDLKLLRAAFFPDDVDVIQVLPRASEYVNVHTHCFHLFQAPAAWEGGWNV